MFGLTTQWWRTKGRTWLMSRVCLLTNSSYDESLAISPDKLLWRFILKFLKVRSGKVYLTHSSAKSLLFDPFFRASSSATPHKEWSFWQRRSQSLVREICDDWFAKRIWVGGGKCYSYITWKGRIQGIEWHTAGYSCYYIHAKMAQAHRNRVFHDFRCVGWKILNWIKRLRLKMISRAPWDIYRCLMFFFQGWALP